MQWYQHTVALLSINRLGRIFAGEMLRIASILGYFPHKW